MTYTVLTLALLGLFGILIHNLMKLNSLNRKYDGHLNFGRYLALERFSILISVCVVAVALLVRSEIKELEIAGNYLGFAFVAIGYMAQSIVTAFGSKAEKMIDKLNDNP
jgi:hypothetical protein